MNYGSSLKSNLSLSVIDVILVQSRKRNLSQSTQIGGGAIVKAGVRCAC